MPLYILDKVNKNVGRNVEFKRRSFQVPLDVLHGLVPECEQQDHARTSFGVRAPLACIFKKFSDNFTFDFFWLFCLQVQN